MRILLTHAQSDLNTFIDAGADITVVMHEHDLGTVMTHQLSPFFTHRVRHDNDRLIAADCTDQCKTNSLVSARRLDDNGIFIYYSGFFSRQDHVKCRSGLDRSSDIQSLKFHIDFSAVFWSNMIEPYQWCPAHRFKYISAEHWFLPSLVE